MKKHIEKKPSLRDLAETYNTSAATLCRLRNYEGLDIYDHFDLLSRLIWIDGYQMPLQFQNQFQQLNKLCKIVGYKRFKEMWIQQADKPPLEL